MTRPRNKGYKDLPPNLYYHKASKMFVYRHPITKRRWYIPPGDDAYQIAIEANLRLMQKSERVRQILNLTINFSEWCNRFEDKILAERKLAISTLKDYKLKLKQIRKHPAFQKNIDLITTLDCSEFLDLFPPTQSNRYRSLIVDMLNEACSKGHLEINPAQKIKPKVLEKQRQRLTLKSFWAIYNHKETPKFLRDYMLLALLTTQRPADVCRMKIEHIYDGKLHVAQRKRRMKKRIAIVINKDLQAAIDQCGNDEIGSPYLVHKIPESRRAHNLHDHHTYCNENIVAREFARIRDQFPEFKQMLPAAKPTLYEIRSLGIAELEKRGFDSTLLAGHDTKEMNALYKEGHDIWEQVDVSVCILDHTKTPKQNRE